MCLPEGCWDIHTRTHGRVISHVRITCSLGVCECASCVCGLCGCVYVCVYIYVYIYIYIYIYETGKNPGKIN